MRLVVLAALASDSAAATPPNFLIFQPDDLPFFWADAPPTHRTKKRHPTPALDALRAESAVFTRAYVTSATCGEVVGQRPRGVAGPWKKRSFRGDRL